MYEILKRGYREGKITREKLQVAVTKGWITQEQYEEIINE